MSLEPLFLLQKGCSFSALVLKFSNTEGLENIPILTRNVFGILTLLLTVSLRVSGLQMHLQDLALPLAVVRKTLFRHKIKWMRYCSEMVKT